MASPSERTAVPAGDPFTNVSATFSSWDPRGLLAHADLLYIEVRLVASAMGIIFLGAHAALRRPPSAALPKPRAKDKKPRDEKDDHFAEGLTPSDAVVFPFMAGIVLVGLYYIIQWLQDPAILNKILRVYMSTVSVVSMSKLSADALHLLTSLVFPSVWADSKGRVYRVYPGRCRHCLLSGVSAGHAGQPMEERKTPFPGKASDWALKDRTNNMLWALRHLLTEEWTVRFAIHGIFHEKFAIRLNDMIGVLIAVAVTSTYHLTNAPWLANLMGFGFCYGAFMIMSCTTFSTGTLVLMGLFVYDIVMVFYTPFMITVATKIDAPIKLVFEGAARPDGTPRSSLLGLGDIVIPGIFMCLSMRFDLYRYWQKQIRYEPTELTTEMTSGGADEKTTALVSTETRYRAVRAPFVDPQGRWGDRLWTTRKWSRLLSSPTATPELLASAFPKTYFYASIVGYGIGMVLTLSMLLLFQHGQPALLYLVPGVVGSVWLTGWFRGELQDMWKYTEDGSLDTEDVVVELDADGSVVREIDGKKKKDDSDKDEKKSETEAQSGEKTGGTSSKSADDEDNKSKRNAREKGYDVFHLSITAPGQVDSEED